MNPETPTGFRKHYVLYIVAVVAVFLLILDGVVIWMERSGQIETGTQNDRAWLATGDPWVEDGDRFVVSPADKASMVPMTFRRDKGSGWRAFMLGGSFFRGVPYQGIGTIRFWLKRRLDARFPDGQVELINAAATSQNSNRVKEIARFASAHEPDLLIIASCNNEGALPPSEVTRRLHGSGTFRLFRRLLKSETPASERPIHTPQDPDIAAVRDAFRANLLEMVRRGRAAGASVFLATLPVNLRYEGNSPGRPIAGPEHPSEISWPPCVSQGHALYVEKNYPAALKRLAECEHEEALRWMGLSHYALGEYELARLVLTQYLEVVPRNRCRPSFNAVIRDVAETEKVPLIDLHKAVKSKAPHGIPGDELFASYCHMNWQGQALIADTIMAAIRAHGPRPQGKEIDAPPEDRDRVYKEWKGRASESAY